MSFQLFGSFASEDTLLQRDAICSVGLRSAAAAVTSSTSYAFAHMRPRTERKLSFIQPQIQRKKERIYALYHKDCNI